MKYLTPIFLVLYIVSYSQTDSLMNMKLKEEIRQESKPVYIEAETKIIDLRNYVDMAKKHLIAKTIVVSKYNLLVGATMGKLTTFEAVDKRLKTAGDQYVQFMFLKEEARIAKVKAAEAKFQSGQRR